MGGRIAAFETIAEESPPPANAVVFVGISSIRFWDILRKGMFQIAFIQPGIGEAKLNHLIPYADRLVNVYKPIAVVVFAGSHDIIPDRTKPSKQRLASYQ